MAAVPALKSHSEATTSRFNPEQAALIKRTICKGATDDELKMFMWQCERTGLDPFARQIYSIARRENRDGQWITVRSIQVSIDGFRLIAERSGKYAGQVGPFWCGADGQWQDVWVSDEPPKAGRVGVLRSDFKEPCWGVARYDAYAQKNKEGRPVSMWAKMPDVMLAKCAEALALRKAFPQELSGLYTTDEMEQSTQETRPNPHVTRPEEIVDAVEYDSDGNPINNIPRGDAEVERMSKTMARPHFAAAQQQLRAIKTVDELKKWGEANANSIESFPLDWQEIMRGIYTDQMNELKKQRVVDGLS